MQKQPHHELHSQARGEPTQSSCDDFLAYHRAIDMKRTTRQFACLSQSRCDRRHEADDLHFKATALKAATKTRLRLPPLESPA